MNIEPYITRWWEAKDIWWAEHIEPKFTTYAAYSSTRADGGREKESTNCVHDKKKHRRKNCCPKQFELEEEISFFFGCH